jgi:hypothetical protein
VRCLERSFDQPKDCILGRLVGLRKSKQEQEIAFGAVVARSLIRSLDPRSERPPEAGLLFSVPELTRRANIKLNERV